MPDQHLKTQESAKPTRKVAAGAVAAAVTTLAVYLLNLIWPGFPAALMMEAVEPHIAAAVSGLLATAASLAGGYMRRSSIDE